MCEPREAALVAASVLVIALICAPGRAAQPASTHDADDPVTCAFYFEHGSKNTVSHTGADYRLRDSSVAMRGEFEINWQHHTGPAIKAVQAHTLTSGVMADIDFTLQRWPNHRDALRALIEYDLEGGKHFQYAPTVCYLRNAREFAADDPDVILAQAYYDQRKGNAEQARVEYQQALTMRPDSAEAHYNLGLLYFEQSDFTHAREQARLAYAAGYPLPGLRHKLEKVGQWTEASPPAAAPAAAADPKADSQADPNGPPNP